MNKLSEEFKERLSKGKEGERAIVLALSNVTEVRDLTDYDKYEAYQKKCLDFEFLNKETGAWDRGDAKANITEQGYTFLELNKGNGSLGWFYLTKSDWIYCYSRYTKLIYYYAINPMREYVAKGVETGILRLSEVADGSKGTWVNVIENTLVKKFEN